MKFAMVIERLMTRLGSIPGLSFLAGYVVAAKTAKTRFGQRKGDYEAYIDNITGAGAEVRDAVGGDRGGGDEDDDDHEDAHDNSPEAVDWYDEYEEEDSVLGPGSTHIPQDDYPASDDNNPYFDDDYRN